MAVDQHDGCAGHGRCFGVNAVEARSWDAFGGHSGGPELRFHPFRGVVHGGGGTRVAADAGDPQPLAQVVQMSVLAVVETGGDGGGEFRGG